MKQIIVQPYKVSDPKKYWGYPVEMRVVESDHPKYTVGYRFDYSTTEWSIQAGYELKFLSIVNGDPTNK